jgi:hypothetical protein
VVRLRRDHDLPRHFEACSLATWARWAGWPLAGACCIGGISLVVRAESKTVEGAAALGVLVGVLLVVGLVRCRRYEIVVGRRTLGLSCGPYRHTVPLGSIEKGEARAAGGWRRLYADRELELVTSLGDRRFLVPTRDENELRPALGCE